MDKFFYTFGVIIFYLFAIFGGVLIVGYLLEIIINAIARRWKVLFRIVEYSIYRKKFKKWVKNKKRYYDDKGNLLK